MTAKSLATPIPIEPEDADLYAVPTHTAGPGGRLPLDADLLLHAPSGDVFGLSQNAGMGWSPHRLRNKEFLMLSTQGGIRAPDGRPVALGYHTGHWEVGLLMQAAAAEFSRLETTPFAGFVTDPCAGRTQGTAGMMDSLAYRNDAALVLRRLIRSLPTRRGVMGVATAAARGLTSTVTFPTGNLAPEGSVIKPVGRPAKRGRRHLGRLRLRRGRDREAARSRPPGFGDWRLEIGDCLVVQYD